MNCLLVELNRPRTKTCLKFVLILQIPLIDLILSLIKLFLDLSTFSIYQGLKYG